MRKIEFSQAITILANVGVIAGIIFLAIELRQVQDQMDAQISFNRFSERNQGVRLIATNPLLAGMMVKSQAGEELTGEETVMLGSYVRSMLFSTEYAWQQHQRGRLEDFDFQTTVSRIERDTWGMAGIWEQLSRDVLDEDFVAAVEQELEQ